ncbi:PGK [Artemisia annua]|uniref:PGK n=1 Tax=Artemisia annua TaxID=35608 RepID=A0A2U1MT07_ARTAN|nr:PGK [Artemisia annua]
MKKDKSVLIPNPSGASNSKHKSPFHHDTDNNDEEEQFNANDFHLPTATRNGSSKYDFVKVKVWLGDNADHYYVLSRFLLSRMLTVTKVSLSIHFIIDFVPSSVYIFWIVDFDFILELFMWLEEFDFDFLVVSLSIYLIVLIVEQ